MRKFIFVFLTLILSVCFLATLFACTPSNDGQDDILKLYGDKDVFEFYVGHINWSEIKLSVYDRETDSESIVEVKESMISDDDLLRVASPGAYTVTIVYQSASVKVTLHIREEERIIEYKIVYNAGAGTFNADGIPTEDSSIKIVYAPEITAIPTPSRPGYEFAGWYESENFTGNKIIAPYVLKRDIILYAKWSDERKYSVTYSCYLEKNNNGNIGSLSGIEHGSEIPLMAPENKVGYEFAYYEIWNASEIYNSDTSQKLYLTEDVCKYTVVSDIKIKLQYVYKILTLTYIADGWTDGTEIGGVVISNKTYVNTVTYGTVLKENELPVPVLPQKEGHTAVWVDDATGKAPIYGTVTSDITVRAVYTIKQYSMYFYTDKALTQESLITNATRTVNYNGCVTSLPDVPAREGYNGEWMVYNKGYDPFVAENEPVSINLRNLHLVDDVNVFAQYYPKTYTISFWFRLQGMTEDIRETVDAKFGEEIDPAVVPDLTVDREYEDRVYSGYHEKYYRVVWYTNNAHTATVDFGTTAKVIVRGEANYYSGVERKPYKVDFRMPKDAGNALLSSEKFYYESRYVEPGGKVIPPMWVLEAYDVIGWSYSYVAPDSDKKVIVEYRFKGMDYETNGWQINDFHEYSENPNEDRAFYPILDEKEYDVVFYNVDLSDDSVTEVRSLGIKHGQSIALLSDSDIVALLQELDPTYVKPENYVFEGWFTDREFLTLPITAGYKVTENMTLYAKWADTLVGTDGLEYEPHVLDNGDIDYYTVKSFVPKNAEYSHVTVRIPAEHNGKPVCAIADNAFECYDKIVCIVEIIIGDNVGIIGDNAFIACNYLQKITLSDNNSSLRIVAGALYSADGSVLYCVPSKLSGGTKFIVPNGVERICGGAFAHTAFTEVSFENGSTLTEIGSFAFDGCTALTRVTLPDSIETIGDYAFRGCTALNTVLGRNLTYNALYKVGYGAFDDCAEVLTTSGDCLMIGNVLVKYMGDEKRFTLDNGVKSIAAGAFDRRLNDHEYSVFALEELTIGSESQLIYIGERAFGSCALLAKINILTATKVIAEVTTFDGVAFSCVLVVPPELENVYTADVAYATLFER